MVMMNSFDSVRVPRRPKIPIGKFEVKRTLPLNEKPMSGNNSWMNCDLWLRAGNWMLV